MPEAIFYLLQGPINPNPLRLPLGMESSEAGLLSYLKVHPGNCNKHTDYSASTTGGLEAVSSASEARKKPSGVLSLKAEI